MRMMQVAIDQIIDMVAVRHLRMAAVCSVNVVLVVPFALMVRRAGVRIFGTDFDHMFIDVIAMNKMQMAIVQIIDVAVVSDGRVAAAGTVLMRVIGVGLTGAHLIAPLMWKVFCAERSPDVRLHAVGPIA